MAYNALGLMRFADGGAIGVGAGSVKGLFDYQTTDAAAAVEAGGYFNAAAPILPVGSKIFASIEVGSATKLKTYVVTGNTGTVVTIAAQTTA
ncbi:hypothetical protein MKI84_12905 [Ancylobacter sp. A5.8]|uniref:hypothetical protein n=1 Tax=Ancylobacter gelatini TaxID=2919920 RepID=UPI001F4D77A9|nr:hypothetical protein [Ancylobacter gelatini]MCJ8143816.1 hypothetical protein [Ancylobacter gelatini]